MRCALLILVLAACTQSDEERLDDLLAKTTVTCGTADYGCVHDADRTVECMNDARANGTRAQMSDEWQDAWGFWVDTYTFTVDDEVVVYDFQASSDTSDEPKARYVKTCAGPFHAGAVCGAKPTDKYVMIDGCR